MSTEQFARFPNAVQPTSSTVNQVIISTNVYSDTLPVYTFTLDKSRYTQEYKESASFFVSSLNEHVSRIKVAHEYYSSKYNYENFINRLDIVLHAMHLIALTMRLNDMPNEFNVINSVEFLKLTDEERFSLLHLNPREFTTTLKKGVSEMDNGVVKSGIATKLPDISIGVWGPQVWRFLHLTSILLYDTNSIAICHFAMMLRNFDRLMWCGNCSHNFKQKNPMANLTVPILILQDSIFVLFTFHNMVNTQKYTKSRQVYKIGAFANTMQLVGGVRFPCIFSYESFCQKYNLIAKFQKNISYSLKL